MQCSHIANKSPITVELTCELAEQQTAYNMYNITEKNCTAKCLNNQFLGAWISPSRSCPQLNMLKIFPSNADEWTVCCFLYHSMPHKINIRDLIGKTTVFPQEFFPWSRAPMLWQTKVLKHWLLCRWQRYLVKIKNYIRGNKG